MMINFRIHSLERLPIQHSINSEMAPIGKTIGEFLAREIEFLDEFELRRWNAGSIVFARETNLKIDVILFPFERGILRFVAGGGIILKDMRSFKAKCYDESPYSYSNFTIRFNTKFNSGFGHLNTLIPCIDKYGKPNAYNLEFDRSDSEIEIRDSLRKWIIEMMSYGLSLYAKPVFERYMSSSDLLESMNGVSTQDSMILPIYNNTLPSLVFYLTLKSLNNQLTEEEIDEFTNWSLEKFNLNSQNKFAALVDSSKRWLIGNEIFHDAVSCHIEEWKRNLKS